MKIYIFTAVSLFSVITMSCTSNIEQQNVVNQSTPNAAANIAENKNPPASNAPPRQPVKTIEELEKINREAFNGKSSPKAQETPAASAVNSGNSPGGRPAPDNSVISSTMDQQGQPVEVRSFKDNPQLLRIEKIYVSTDRKILKVYLKNGRIVELEEDRIPNFAIASVSAILTAAEAQPKR